MIYLVLRAHASSDAHFTTLEWPPRGPFPIDRSGHFIQPDRGRRRCAY